MKGILGFCIIRIQSIKNLSIRLETYIYLVIILFLTSCSYKNRISGSNIVVSPYYSSGMVFQKEKPIVINGTCSANGVLAIKIENSLKYVYANPKGVWSVEFPPVDFNGKFNISIEGVDESIKLEDVSMGNVWVIIGDGWLKGDYKNYEETVESGVFNEEIKCFQPELGYSAKNRLSGTWKSLKRGDIKKSEYLSQFLGEALYENSKETVAIVNLVWPGLNVSDFKQQEISESDTLWKNYLALQKKYERIADSSFNGISKGAVDRRFDDQVWGETDFPIISDKKWFLKNRIVWLRKRILVSEKYLDSDFKINLGALHGQFNFYFNGVEVDKFSGETNNFELLIPDTLMKVWANMLAVRMVAGDSLNGFYSTNPIVTNLSSTYRIDISEGWKHRSYFEPLLPVVTRPDSLSLPLLTDILNPLDIINVKAVVVAGGFHFYSNNENEKDIELALNQITKNFKADNKHLILLSKPGMADSVLNLSLYNALRNSQLVASASADFKIINTLDISSQENIGMFYNDIINRYLKSIGE